jgi:tetratricopeptide (TPR) repeat protein
MRFILIFTFAVAVLACGCGWFTRGSGTNSNVEAPAPTDTKVYPDAETALAEGNRLFDENKTEEAIEAYKQAVKMNPDLAEAHFKLGLSYSLIESEQELVVTSDAPPESNGNQKKEKKPNSIVAFENAVTAYRKMIDADLKNADAFFNLGRVYNRLNKDEESRKALETAVKLKPDDTIYQTEFGAILVKLAEYDQAVRALKKALELDDANAQAIELLEKAEAGKKRVNFGAEQLKQRLQSNQQTSSANSNNASNANSKAPETPDKKPETDKKKQPEKPKSVSNRN